MPVRTPENKSSGLASSAFARHYLRNLGWCLFLPLLRCFSSGGSPRTPIWFNARYWSIAPVGFPIRKSPDQRIFAPPRSLSQLVASFIGSWCQGIPLALFIAWPKEIFWFSSWNSAGNLQVLSQNCNCYPLLSQKCSTIKNSQLFFQVSLKDLSVALLSSHFNTLFSFQGAISNLFWDQISASNSLAAHIQAHKKWWR